MKVAKPLIEKIPGVKEFFDQYPPKLRGMQPSLIVTNVSNEMLEGLPLTINRLRQPHVNV